MQIRTGAHVFAFGDMGAITLLVPSNVQTSSMAYSWNQGATFDECSFTSTGAIVPQGIAVEPKASSQRFFIYGSRSTGNGVVGVVVSVDFTNFHEAACTCKSERARARVEISRVSQHNTHRRSRIRAARNV